MTHERIEINPEIMGGKPVIRGTRIPVETLLRKLGAGMTFGAIRADHPRLARDDFWLRKRLGRERGVPSSSWPGQARA